jgi:PiT family inorganic phosphate transporter
VPVRAGLGGVSVANGRFGLLAVGDAQASRAEALVARLGGGFVTHVSVTLLVAAAGAGAVAGDGRRDAAAGQRHFLLVLGGLVAFSAGGSQVGLALGPLVPLLDDFAVPIVALLLGGGLGLLIGSWTGAPRMIKALSQDYSSLGPRRSIAALIPAFAIAQAAVFFGIPVSFNEIVVSAIVGAGYAAGGSAVSGAKMGYTVLAWVASLVGAFVVGYGAIVAVSAAT